MQKIKEEIYENNLRVLLAKKRLKVSDLAKGTGIAKSTLTALYYERTKRPDITTLQKVANFLNVTIDELMNVEE
ncbi:HTH DNA binding protein [Streptococcus sp. HSISS2]|uniref:helix-turn-helix domain-containing protein n=1 Tax=Streptococcus sp. HSISS2 TaxID=1316411 RepID=UPI00038AD0DB|nr:HTH DNA binding protein [Streptococcus sp. HSISS2]